MFREFALCLLGQLSSAVFTFFAFQALHRVASTQSGVLKPTKEEEDGPEASGSAPDSNSASTSARSTVDQQLTIRSEGPTTAQAHNGFEENSPLAEQQPPATPRLPDALTGFNPKELQQAYEQLQWKFVSIETTDDEAWKIGLKVGGDLSDSTESWWRCGPRNYTTVL